MTLARDTKVPLDLHVKYIGNTILFILYNPGLTRPPPILLQ